MSLITKHYKNRVSTSKNLTPIQCPLKKNEGLIHQNFVEKRNKIKPKYKIHNLVRTAVLQKPVSKGDATNWFYKLYEIREFIKDTKPKLSYRQFSRKII